jgi:hypothetical protein
MNQPNRQLLQNFTINELPNLDTVVLGALELFASRELPSVDIGTFKRPLVVGSGNAEATGRILFADSDAIFASESNVQDKLNHIADIDEVVIVSASGGKHAPIIAKAAVAAGKHVTLITNTPNSLAAQAVAPDQLTEHIFPKNREPYTYNTSTYMGMLLGVTHENAAAIKQFIHETIDPIDFSAFARYDKYYLIVPPEFSGIVRMLQVKFIELFGRNIARDVETSEYVRHATTVAPADELFLAFGNPNTTWGKPESRLNIPLPTNAGQAAMMAVSYYVVGQIQKAKPQYFKENITAYTEFISGIFGETISPIVDGNND